MSEGSHFPNLLSEFVYTRTYARWLDGEKRRETWPETVNRYVGYIFKGKDVPEGLAELAEKLILNFDVLPSMRALWCAGETVDRDHVSAFNCSFLPVDNLRAFSETLAILMNGTGVGFSVEREFVNCLPVIAHPTGDSIDYLIQDSTEGWADAVYFGMVQYHLGHKVNWNYSLIREKGARLKTKGGRASGPEPLKRVLDFAGETIANAAGRHLKPIEAHDIQCMIAEIVMVGGFRRASLISFSDVDDTEMRDAKDWSKGTFPAIRYMSNNSAVYFDRPTKEVFWREWDSLAKSGSGERGFSIVNWSKRADRPDRDIRSNPCHEIGLRFKRATDPWTGAGGGGQFCNLSAAVMRPHDTLETMTEKVRVATWLGAIQASYTYFPYLRPAWKELCLTGDTKVSLLNGKEEKIRDLVGREGFWVYSYDIKAGKMVPGWAHSVRVTQRDAELVRVTLDSGESFDCTPNHPVLLRSGEYREAGSLTPGDSLRPLYRRLSTVEDDGKNGRVGYEMTSTGDGWGFTHALTAGPSNRGACQVCGTELPDNKHWLRHHADFDKRNNEPTNFQWLTRAEHNKLHSDVGSKVLTALWKDPSFRETVRASHWKYFRGTPEYEKMCKENGEFLRDVVTRLWEDPEYRTTTLSRMRAGHRAYVQTDQFQKVQGQMLERLWSNPDFVEKFMRGAREGTRRKWTDEKYREKMGAITRGLWTPEFKEKMRPYQSANGKEYGKRNLLAYNLSEKGRTQSGENLQYERTPEHLAEMSERSKKTCHEMWHVKRERVSEVCIHCNPTNHKVLSVERLSHREDVYDLTVDEHHNFALSCGVFVHNCEEDNLLGVDITGQCDNPALSGDEDSMLYLNGIARSTAIVASHRLGTSRPAAVTCGKPSGNSSVFVDCASGFHTRYSKFYFRHVRISAKDPLYHLIRDQGVPVFKENGQEHLPDDKVDVWVARFPVKSPDGAKLREHEKALEQLERYLQIMRTWCGDKGHNQSATVYVRDEEWQEVGKWLWEHFDEVTGLSFLPYDGGAYRLAPYVEITEEEYLAAQKVMPDVDFTLLTHYETRDEGEGAAEPACMGGACDI